MSRAQAMLLKLIEQAMKGNPRALTQSLNLCASAVPDTQTHDQPRSHEPLTPTDEAILAEFKAMILAEGGQE